MKTIFKDFKFIQVPDEEDAKRTNEIKKKEECIKQASSVRDAFLSSREFLDIEDGDRIRQKQLILYDGRFIDEYQAEVNEIYRNFEEEIRNHNDKLARKMLESNPGLYISLKKPDSDEVRKLDEQQMICILKEKSRNHLVIAGAGTGKTTTIIGKIKFLLELCDDNGKKLYNSNDILVLAFNSKAAKELRDRISKEIGLEIDASTFHSLGYKIIWNCEKFKPDPLDNENGEDRKFLRDVAKSTINEKKITDSNYHKKLTNYLLYYGMPAKSDDSFTSEEEYKEYLKYNPYTTLKKEAVRSFGEREIANFLYINGIDYKYEKNYEKKTCTFNHRQYKPDFYLPESKIYIEYFGIDKNGRVAPFFKCKYSKAASAVYKDAMKWKQSTHDVNETKMIPCFFTEKSSGILLTNLEANLKDYVCFNPKTNEEIYKILTKQEKLDNGFINLAYTIINSIKAKNITYKNAYELVHLKSIGEDKQQNLMVLELVEPIYTNYMNKLKDEKRIDFNDMINLATKYIKEGKYRQYINEGEDRHSYKYIIVDEYQDISKSRYEFIKTLRDDSDSKLFCVGDDWQSIYRFAGSDISFILNFENGITEKSKIETTYRFSQTLADISGGFIMKNKKQIPKEVISDENDLNFSIVEINHTEENYTESIVAELMKIPKPEPGKVYNVFILARYHDDRKCIINNDVLSIVRKDDKKYTVTFTLRKDLKISYYVTHGIKGLEADYIFIINNKDDIRGFPSKIDNAPIIDVLLENNGDYSKYPYIPFAEERRLFYVALTRAKKGVFLMTVQYIESEFIKQLREDNKNNSRYKIIPFISTYEYEGKITYIDHKEDYGYIKRNISFKQNNIKNANLTDLVEGTIVNYKREMLESGKYRATEVYVI